MLKAMRKNTKIFMWLLIIAFVVWLAADVILTKQGTTYAGIIFGKRVSLSEYKKAWEAVKTKAIFTYGDKVQEVAKNLNLDEEAWDRLILLYEARRQKIQTSDSEVISSVKDIAIFKDKNGEFNQGTYERILKYSFGLTPRDFEEQGRDELTIKKMINKQNEKASLTDEEVLKEYKLANEKANASYILFETEKYYSRVSCTEDELKGYFEKNAQKFTILEQVNVEFFGKNFTDETEETKEKTKNQIQGISDEVSEKKDFEGIAKKYSMQIKETGFFGSEDKIPGIGWAFNFANVALSLKPGEISYPIVTKGGVYILKVKAKKQARPAKFEEVKERVEKTLRTEKAENEALLKAKEVLSIIKTRVEKKDKFEDIIKELSLTAKETDAFTRNTYIEGLGVVKEFTDAAFLLKEGEIYNEPVKVHNGCAILKLSAFIPIDENKYKEEKDKFKEQLLTQKRYLNLLTWFYDLRERAKLKVIK
ncbi:MAG: SurA N-terminal domain-containing protein [Candidatus Omnitrophota bacterium]